MSFTHSVRPDFEKFRIWSHEAVQLFFEPLGWIRRGVGVLLGRLLVSALEPAHQWKALHSYYALRGVRDITSVDPRFAKTVKELISIEFRGRVELLKSASSLVFILDQKLSNAETECLEALYQSKLHVPKSSVEQEVLQHLFRIGFVEIASERLEAHKKKQLRSTVKLSEAGAIYLAMLQQERRKRLPGVVGRSVPPAALGRADD